MMSQTGSPSRSAHPLLLSAALAILTAAAGVASGQAPVRPAHPPAPAASEDKAAPLQDDASHQEVKVHGHWTITVKNPNGTTASHFEVENSLTLDATIFLTAELVGTYVINGYGVDLMAAQASTSICGVAHCWVLSSNSSTVGPGPLCAGTNSFGVYANCSAGLTFSAAGSPLALTLVGQTQAVTAGTITAVGSLAFDCHLIPESLNTVSAAGCRAAMASSYHTLTSVGAPAFAPVNVNAGQIVQVTVALTFS